MAVLLPAFPFGNGGDFLTETDYHTVRDPTDYTNSQ